MSDSDSNSTENELQMDLIRNTSINEDGSQFNTRSSVEHKMTNKFLIEDIESDETKPMAYQAGINSSVTGPSARAMSQASKTSGASSSRIS